MSFPFPSAKKTIAHKAELPNNNGMETAVTINHFVAIIKTTIGKIPPTCVIIHVKLNILFISRSQTDTIEENYFQIGLLRATVTIS